MPSPGPESADWPSIVRKLRPAAVAVLTVAAVLMLVSCGSAGSSSPVSASNVEATTTATTGTPSQSPLVPNYSLQPGSHLSIATEGKTWTASSGELTVLSASGGGSKFVAVAKGQPDGTGGWTLTLTVSTSGRAIAGSVKAGEQEWQIQENTGILPVAITGSIVTVATKQAVTVNHGTMLTNSPMTLAIRGSAVQKPQPEPSSQSAR